MMMINVAYNTNWNCFNVKQALYPSTTSTTTTASKCQMTPPVYFTKEILADIITMIDKSSTTLNDLKINIHLKYGQIPKNRIEHKIKELAMKNKGKWMIKPELREMYGIDATPAEE